MADFFEAGKIPEVRKIAALLGFHGLDGAVVAGKEFAFAIGFFEQRKTLPIRAHARVAFDELRLAQVEVRGDARDLGIGKAHLAGPATTGRATLTLVENRHGDISGINARRRNAEARL